MFKKPMLHGRLSSVIISSLLATACTTLPVSGPHSDDIRRDTIYTNRVKPRHNPQDNTGFYAYKNVVQPVDHALKQQKKLKRSIEPPIIRDDYALVHVDGFVLGKTLEYKNISLFNWPLDQSSSPEPVRISVGDTISMTIYEAQSGGVFIPLEAGVRPGNFVQIPAQIIDDTGVINVPYAGKIKAVGLTPVEVASIVTKRLSNIAIKPQVVVSFVNRAGSEISVLGQVRNSVRYALNFNGERVLDAIARAQGPSIPGYEAEVTLQRDNSKYTIPFSELVDNIQHNIYLKPNDIIYVENNPQTFTLMGATQFQGEYSFDRQKITLTEALSRGEGLNDNRADPSEVYVYRVEKLSFLETLGVAVPDMQNLADQEMPTIYKFDLRNPHGYFLAQKFPILNNDVVYVGNAETVEILKLLNVINPSAVTTINTRQTGR